MEPGLRLKKVPALRGSQTWDWKISRPYDQDDIKSSCLIKLLCETEEKQYRTWLNCSIAAA